MNCDGWGVQRWALHLTKLLNALNPPDRYRFDIGELAKEVSRNFYPADPIHSVVGSDLRGFEGALLPSESGRRWAILYDRGPSRRRRRFTVAHEFGHYLLHRKAHPQGIRNNEAAVDGRDGVEIEREANEFASTLLMPLDDFRRQISPRDKADFEQLSFCATRYDVSLAATILRWLRYTDRRAMIVVSRDGFVKWAWSSEPAFRSGRFIRTSGSPVEIPSTSSVGREEFTGQARMGINHPAGVWFDEPVRELSIRSESYDLNYSILHFDGIGGNFSIAESHVEDAYERFTRQ